MAGEKPIGAMTAVPITRRHIAAAVAGNALEFYDFTAYTFFAIQIGQAFFPLKTQFFTLLASLVVFGVGFVGRPIGGIVLGIYADRYGRRPALVLSFMLMGAGILALALTPSYAAIGIAAPILVVISRIVQGIALGGQVGPATAYLLEAATPQTRGFYTTLQFASQGLAALLGGFAAFVLSQLLSPEHLASYGWRIAFLLGAAVLPFGFVLQRALPETFEARASGAVRESMRPHLRVAVLGFIILSSATVAVYTLYYLPTYAQAVLHMRASVASASGMVFGACNLVFSLASGWLSDRIGRKPVMIWARVVLCFVILPLFLWLIARNDAATLLIATAVIAALATFSAGAALVAIAESLPVALRSGTLGTIYAVAIASFGGTAQALEQWLVGVTGSPLAPAWYLTAATLAGVVAMMLMPESAPAKAP
jgi:MFS transporter, MHS family, citrate/tricarballylate:H+ symporter